MRVEHGLPSLSCSLLLILGAPPLFILEGGGFGKGVGQDASWVRVLRLERFVSGRPLVYTVSLLLPAAYLIGLCFTLKTHSHIYDIHISDCHSKSSAGLVGRSEQGQHGPNVSKPQACLPLPAVSSSS